MKQQFLFPIVFFALAISIVQSHAFEPWADKKLTVTNGLAVWLDAGKEIAARTVRKPINGGPIDRWHDASGNKRDVQQLVSAARPRFIQQASGAAFRFDGVDDFLTVTGLEQELEETTIFILAAPKANKGEFGAFLAINREGVNDYSSGLNVDMANGAKKNFDFVNVEGVGFIGVQDLMTSTVPFGEAHALTITAQAGTNGARLYVDGVVQEEFFRNTTPHKSRRNQKAAAKNAAPVFGFDQLTVGARFFSNTGEPPYVQGFFEGDLIEVLIYDRVLSEGERAEVEKYLKAKLVSKIAGRALAPLIPVNNPAPVQMFVPGFSVREMPIELGNINNVKYREDGKLVALGYDGRIWLLTDTDGDGLEDKASAFWTNNTLRAPIGMALTPPNYPKGRGVFAPSKGKVSLIVDTNNDDVADEEIIVADGWKEGFHNVDALGVAVDEKGNVYFGLGTANFADAYLKNKEGKSQYDLKNEKGTIMKVSPDFKTREIISTGIRFPVALAFNPAGDLFCSDQEGATWLPNGNPLDELLHVEQGKHYGFPPRHPKHLPGVIDEPSVFDYAPQHQCTCGINFNEPVNGGPIFGPSFWRGDVFVAGYSRGKLYRTKLVKTATGYVAQNQIIASLNMLPPDICVSPQGDLVVPVHSGKPDWGTGPTGMGKLYKISYTDKKAPQPIAAWPVSPTETEIQFDRPLDPAPAKELAQGLSVTQGKYVAAGDQFETNRPGYQVVQNQTLEPRYVVKVLSTALSLDGRTLSIRTEPRLDAVGYGISMPRKTAQKNNASSNELPQEPNIELAHDLTGVEAEWQTAAGEKTSAWLPHLDLSVARAFTKPVTTLEKFWANSSKAGKLKLRAQLDLSLMLRTAIQPGSDLDFKYPQETVTVVLKSKSPLTVAAPSMKLNQLSANEIHLTAEPKENVWFPLEITIPTFGVPPSGGPGGEPSKDGTPNNLSLDVSWFTAEDSRQRALPLRRIFVPWALPEQDGDAKKIERVVPEIAGGNWVSGRKIFLGDQAACSKCHVVGHDGTKIGPDLSNLIHRDYASVMKDILEPTAAINPDHISYNVELKNGESLNGVLVGTSETESKFADASGKITAIPKSQIASMKPSTLSLMPEGLLQALSEQERKDLLTFLLMPTPLEPAPLENSGEPKPRKLSEVKSILGNGTPARTGDLKTLKIILCSGPKDHGPGEHDYPLWQKRWNKLLSLAENVSVENADVWPSAEQMNKADVIVFYSNNPGWSADRASELDKFLNRGGGAVYIHFAVDGHKHCDELAQRIGLAWRGGAAKFRHGPLDLKFQPHAISEGFSETHFVDESYWQLTGSETNIQLLASGIEDGKPQPLMWTREQGKGRVFVSIPGHYNWTFDDPLFRLLIFRGIAWSAHDSLDRFNELVTLGARVGE